jgi:hypothetical protein
MSGVCLTVIFLFPTSQVYVLLFEMTGYQPWSVGATSVVFTVLPGCDRTGRGAQPELTAAIITTIPWMMID